MAKEIVVPKRPEKAKAGGVLELEFDEDQIDQNIFTQESHGIVSVRNGGAPVVITRQKSLQRQEGVVIRIN